MKHSSTRSRAARHRRRREGSAPPARPGGALLLILGLLVSVIGVVLPASPAAALHPEVSASWGTVPLTGGGFVSGLGASDTTGPMYARTDIGGAYRRDGNQWVPILDQLPGLGDPVYGVDALSVDPDNPQHVWVAAGRVRGSGSVTNPTPGGSGWVLRSTNGGSTWTNTQFPNAASAVISGNMDGRWIGPRIAIDPFNDDRAYFGTRADGLWVSDNGTWTKVPGIPDGGGITPTTPPNREGYATNPVGVSFVAVRNDSPHTPSFPDRARVVYAAVWDQGVYKSVDGGASFSLMNGSPKRLRAGMVSPSAVFYGVGEMGGDGTEMGLWRTEPDGSWTNQDPCGATCDDQDLVALDIDNQGNIVVGVRVRGIRDDHPVYYCTYNGSSCNGRWTNIVEPATQQGWRDDANLTGTEHLASLKFAPHAAGAKGTQLWASDFYGTSTATLSGTTWNWADSTFGIELTAATDLAAASPNATTMRLYGGDIDMSGMRHDSLTATPTYMLPPANATTAGGSQDTTGIDVGPTGIVYRVGAYPRNHTRPGGWSANAGVSWTGFNNSSPAAYGGRIAVAPDDPDRLVWVPMESTPRTSTNRGSSWTVLTTPNTTGTIPPDLTTNNSGILAATQFANGNAADDDFYVFDPRIGFFRATTTSGSGLSFTKVSNALPDDYGGGWPSLRHGVVADPFQNGVVVAGVCGTSTDASRNGFWFSSNRGTTFTKRSGISCAEQVAIGAPLAGGGPSTIYVLGREPGGSTQQQLFFSTDNGGTWSRMDRTGLVSTTGFTNLEADPKIPGRIYMSAKGRGTFTGLVGGSTEPPVDTVPAAPAAPVVEEGSNAVAVDWNAPADGGSPITSYRVTVTNAAGTVIGTKQLSGTATAATITTLDGGAPAIDNGGTYRFRVQATNAVGTGAASPLSDVAIPPHRPPAGVDSVSHFLAEMSGNMVGGAWTTTELAAFASQIRSGAATTPSIIVARREEADSRSVLMVEPLTRLYEASFLRQPDTAGFQYWLDLRKAGTSMDTIANRFTDTTEFGNRYDALDDEDFVRQVYLNVLDRPADQAGVDFWVDQMQDQGRSRGWVIYRFSNTPEYGNLARHIIEACTLQWGMTATMPNNATLAQLVAQTGQHPSYDAAGRVGMVRIIMDNPEYLDEYP